MTTGDKIKMLRIQHGMTQEELGAKIGVKKSAIYKYENGIVVNLKRSTIAKLASVLDVSPSWLMSMGDDSELIPPGFEPVPELVRVPYPAPGPITAWMLDFRVFMRIFYFLQFVLPCFSYTSSDL